MISDYDKWKTTPDDVQPDVDSDYVHKDDLPDFDHIRDHLQGCIEAIYHEGDIYKLEMCLEEVCGQLGVEYTVARPKLVNELFNRDLLYQMGYQRAILDYQSTDGDKK